MGSCVQISHRQVVLGAAYITLSYRHFKHANPTFLWIKHKLLRMSTTGICTYRAILLHERYCSLVHLTYTQVNIKRGAAVSPDI